MADDYYPILARAVSRLAINDAQARREVYERAQTIVIAELRRQDPQKSASETMRELAALLFAPPSLLECWRSSP